MRRSDEWVVLDAAAADVGASGSAGCTELQSGSVG